MTLDFDRDGAVRVPRAINTLEWIEFLEPYAEAAAGVRLHGLAGLTERLGTGSVACDVATSLIGKPARPVRAILFNKTAANNWPLGWHQDRTIAIAARHEVEGFGPWTVKQGLLHVEPPVAVIAGMITVRIHLNDVDADNAPLRVALGSHLLGRIAESDYDAVTSRHDILTCLADAGDIWAYSTPILHASAAAARPRQRRVLQVDYAAEPLPAPLEWARLG